jgi:drug/metabolite transporter (DMT)-like permease
MSKKIKADLALLFVTLTWGISFILTKNTISNIEVFNFLALRFSIAFLLSSMFFNKKMMHLDKQSIKYGIIVGFVLFSGFTLQTIGLLYTSTTNSAFITGLSVIIVPIISASLFKTKIKKSVKFGVFVALIGLSLLTLNGITVLNIGDFYSLLSAIVFALYIVLVGYFTTRTDSILFAIMQIGAVGTFSAIISILFETPTLAFSSVDWLNILFLALFCTAGAFIIQSIAQQYTTSTHTALIFINEPVFAAIFGYFIAGEILGVRGLLGGLLMLSGILFAELDIKNIKILKKA